jgi:hypothetical protein
MKTIDDMINEVEESLKNNIKAFEGYQKYFLDHAGSYKYIPAALAQQYIDKSTEGLTTLNELRERLKVTK